MDDALDAPRQLDAGRSRDTGMARLRETSSDRRLGRRHQGLAREIGNKVVANSAGTRHLFRKRVTERLPFFFARSQVIELWPARYTRTRLNSSNSFRSGQVRPSITSRCR